MISASIYSRFKSSLNVLGLLLGLLGVVFVIYKLNQNYDDLNFSDLPKSFKLMALLLAFFYGVANLFLVASWMWLLKNCGESFSRLWLVHCYGISQLAKYLPGNIFHLAGRQAISMSHGYNAKVVAKSIAQEMVLIILSGLLFVVFVLPIVIPNFSASFSIRLMIFALVFIFALWGLGLVFSKWVSYALAAQVAFLACSGIIFSIILHDISHVELKSFGLIQTASVYILAWLAGYLTPGAPAGIGVREVVAAAFLNGLFLEGDLIIAIAMTRFVNILGDFLFYCFALVLKKFFDL